MKQKVFNLIILDESGSMSMTDAAGTSAMFARESKARHRLFGDSLA